MSDTDLKDQIAYLASDFSGTDRSLEEIFKIINTDLRKFSFEIRSVRMPIQGVNGTNLQMYHGIVNMEEDAVAKDHGSCLDVADIKLFALISIRILQVKYLSTDDVISLQPGLDKKRLHIESLIARLEAAGWLRRNDSNYLVLGIRSYLELQDLEDEDEKTSRAQEINRVIELMPQQIVY